MGAGGCAADVDVIVKGERLYIWIVERVSGLPIKELKNSFVTKKVPPAISASLIMAVTWMRLKFDEVGG